MRTTSAITYSQATPRAARWVEDGKADGEREGSGARRKKECVAPLRRRRATQHQTFTAARCDRTKPSGRNTLAIDMEYHILGGLSWVQVEDPQAQSPLWIQALAYEDCRPDAPTSCAGQYGGNISRIAQYWAGSTERERDMAFTYDPLNRLTRVQDKDLDAFAETFGYDPQGRITWQRRGAQSTQSTGGEYHYLAQSNKLGWVNDGMEETQTRNLAGSTEAPAFTYDANGNLLDDKSKDMALNWDHRNMPTEMVRVGESDDTRLEMYYDAGGNRVSKRVYRRTVDTEGNPGQWTLDNATHYTGMGLEIRERGATPTKVIANLPQGLGRYGTGNALEWNIKNHLGSTMLVVRTQTGAVPDVIAAYDYHAYGKRVGVMEPTEKITEEFTGKELDDETDLNYFGARYLDADLGLWLGVDPKRQRFNPYRYANLNPFNRIDPTGLADAGVIVEGEIGLIDVVAGGAYGVVIDFDNLSESGIFSSTEKEGWGLAAGVGVGVFFSTTDVEGTSVKLFDLNLGPVSITLDLAEDGGWGWSVVFGTGKGMVQSLSKTETTTVTEMVENTFDFLDWFSDPSGIENELVGAVPGDEI